MALAWKTRHHKQGSVKFRPNGFGCRMFGPKIFCSIVRVDDHLIMSHKNYFFLSYSWSALWLLLAFYYNSILVSFLRDLIKMACSRSVCNSSASLSSSNSSQAIDCGQSNTSSTSKIISNWSWSSSCSSSVRLQRWKELFDRRLEI